LGEKELEPGTYQQIRLIIGKTAEEENNINDEPHPYANYVVLSDGSYAKLKIPSGYNTGIKLVHPFEVEADRFMELLLDFEASKSVVATGSGKYILKPTIKVIDTINKSEVYGEVTDAETESPITGALVSAQVADGQVVHSTLTSDAEGQEGRYSLLLPPDQTFNIVVYSDIKVDDQLYSPACSAITVPLNEDLRQDFTLAKSLFGTISGEVTFSGVIDENDPPVVYLSFYTTLDCGYVEVTSLAVNPDPDYTFSVELPLGTYDVVASSEGLGSDTEAGVALTTAGQLVEDINLEL
jgi:hypothetical protein